VAGAITVDHPLQGLMDSPPTSAARFALARHGHGDDQDHVYDHHRSLRLGARLERGKARLSEVVRGSACRGLRSPRN
jgi:hypothetical protein